MLGGSIHKAYQWRTAGLHLAVLFAQHIQCIRGLYTKQRGGKKLLLSGRLLLDGPLPEKEFFNFQLFIQIFIQCLMCGLTYIPMREDNVRSQHDRTRAVHARRVDSVRQDGAQSIEQAEAGRQAGRLTFKPCDGIKVQVVGGLVQQQQVGL